jgi:hypothetical protein
MEQGIPAGSTSKIWLAALIVAGLATWLCYEALPGINWPIWTVTATGLFLFIAQPRLGSSRLVAFFAAAAVIISGAAPITANPFIHFLIFAIGMLLLGMAMLLSAAPLVRRITAGFTIAAPVMAITNALVSAVRRTSDASTLVGSSRARAVIRGLVITLPVLIVFSLLLASADPTFALWRNTIERILTSWEFLPRTAFFLVIFAVSLGVYSYGLLAKETPSVTPVEPHRWLGSAERLILISSVAGLLWLFLLVQLSYLFGNLPQVTGSGITFAEYARRGFGELTIVASATALLIIAAERFGVRDNRQRTVRYVTLAVIAAVLFLLGSAFNRVVLYEAAYGFTTARLYAQVFMILIAVALLALVAEVIGELDPGRLFRRVGAAALLLFIGLIYWNHEAWIARKNIERYTITGKLDAPYLVRDLSLDAVPTIVGAIPSIGEPFRSELRTLLERRYRNRRNMLLNVEWYEASLSRSRARESLASLGLP